MTVLVYLDEEGAEDDAAEDEVVEDALEDVPLAVDLPGVDLVEELHQHEGVEDDGVVFRGRGVEGRIPAAVDVKHFLACGNKMEEKLLYLSRAHTQKKRKNDRTAPYRRRAE